MFSSRLFVVLVKESHSELVQPSRIFDWFTQMKSSRVASGMAESRGKPHPNFCLSDLPLTMGRPH